MTTQVLDRYGEQPISNYPEVSAVNTGYTGGGGYVIGKNLASSRDGADRSCMLVHARACYVAFTATSIMAVTQSY